MKASTIFFATWTLQIAGAISSFAQTATLTVSHDDPDGIVAPGETIQVTATLAWQGNSGLGLVAGNVRATSDLGIATNPVFPYTAPLLPATVIQPGTPAGGSILGIDIQSGDSGVFFGFPPLHPWGLRTGLHLTQFHWTAPTTLGPVEFIWVPDAVNPLPLMMQSGFISFSIPTTYLGTSLTVVPAPASTLLLALAPALLPSRRRR